MKVYHSLEEFEKLPFAVATTGTFDGVHVGHRVILNRLIQQAQIHGGESVLFTFHPHPRTVLQPDFPMKMITSLEEKIERLEALGLDHLIIHPFTKEFARTTSLDFVRNILVNTIGVKKLVIGYDHHFGRNREGSFEHLKEYGPLYGFDVEEIPAQEINEVNVSSTKIRNAIAEGNIALANDYLSTPFPLSGTVITGQKIGRTLGFPTANISVDKANKLLPANGAYAVWVTTKYGRHMGMCNIGNRPTVNGKDISIEVHLLEFNQELYGEQIQLAFVERIREEVKFDHVDDLKAQLEKDRTRTQSLLAQ